MSVKSKAPYSKNRIRIIVLGQVFASIVNVVLCIKKQMQLLNRQFNTQAYTFFIHKKNINIGEPLLFLIAVNSLALSRKGDFKKKVINKQIIIISALYLVIKNCV